MVEKIKITENCILYSDAGNVYSEKNVIEEDQFVKMRLSGQELARGGVNLDIDKLLRAVENKNGKSLGICEELFYEDSGSIISCGPIVEHGRYITKDSIIDQVDDKDIYILMVPIQIYVKGDSSGIETLEGFVPTLYEWQLKLF